MRKYSAVILLAIFGFCAFNVVAEDEKPVFKSLRCNICHKADTGKAYPSLKEIAKVYKGDGEKLEKYLKGDAEPIVNKEKGKSMDKYLEKTKALSEDEMKELVDYILSNKE
jgi:cytochrome c551/c552